MPQFIYQVKRGGAFSQVYHWDGESQKSRSLKTVLIPLLTTLKSELHMADLVMMQEWVIPIFQPPILARIMKL